MAFSDKEKTYVVVATSLGPHNEAYETRQTFKGKSIHDVLKKLVDASSCASVYMSTVRIEYIPEPE